MEEFQGVVLKTISPKTTSLIVQIFIDLGFPYVLNDCLDKRRSSLFDNVKVSIWKHQRRVRLT